MRVSNKEKVLRELNQWPVEASFNLAHHYLSMTKLTKMPYASVTQYCVQAQGGVEGSCG